MFDCAYCEELNDDRQSDSLIQMQGTRFSGVIARTTHGQKEHTAMEFKYNEP